IRELAQAFAAEDLQLNYQIAAQGRAEIGLAPDEHAGFMMTLLRMLAFAPAEVGAATLPVSPSRVAAPVTAAHRVAEPAAAVAAPSAWAELVGRLGLSAMANQL